jgi:hypothetical protein
MRKNSWNVNFLFYYNYSEPENCSDLLKLFDLIFSIFGADSELFNFLFFSRSGFDNNPTFFEKLKKNYKKEDKKLKLITDWIKKNLGHDFLRK